MAHAEIAPLSPAMPIQVAALYHFTNFEDPAVLRPLIKGWCDDLGIRGTLLLAREGINGTISGADAAVAELIGHLRGLPGCAELEVKYSRAEQHPFGRMKVKLKREIVTMNAGELDPARNAGIYVEPQDWNALISDPEVIVIDTRNDYEVAVGTFAGAIDRTFIISANFRPGLSGRRRAGRRKAAVRPKSRCSARAGYAVRNRPPLRRGWAWIRSITLKVASSNIWKKSQRIKVFGRVTASCSMNVFQWDMVSA